MTVPRKEAAISRVFARDPLPLITSYFEYSRWANWLPYLPFVHAWTPSRNLPFANPSRTSRCLLAPVASTCAYVQGIFVWVVVALRRVIPGILVVYRYWAKVSEVSADSHPSLGAEPTLFLRVQWAISYVHCSAERMDDFAGWDRPRTCCFRWSMSQFTETDWYWSSGLGNQFVFLPSRNCETQTGTTGWKNLEIIHITLQSLR